MRGTLAVMLLRRSESRLSTIDGPPKRAHPVYVFVS